MNEVFELMGSTLRGVRDFVLDNFIALLVGLIIAACILLVVRVETSPTFSLKKSEWACSKQELRNTVRVVSTLGSNGSMGTSAVPTVEAVCVNYERTK